MRRMIPGILIDKIKNLFASVSTDEYGNVKIGHNVEIDGSLKTSSDADIEGVYVGGDRTFDELKNQGLYTSTDESDPNDTYRYLKIIGGLEKDGQGAIISASGISFDESGVYYATWDSAENMFQEDYLATATQVDEKIGKIKYYRHHLTLTTAGGVDHQDYYSSSNINVDSLQILTSITSKHPFGSGANEYKFNTSTNIWERWTSSSTEAVTAVTDDVQLV